MVGDDGTVRHVLSTTQGYGDLYRVKHGNAVYTVNGNHTLVLLSRRNQKEVKMSVYEYLCLPRSIRESFQGIQTLLTSFPEASDDMCTDEQAYMAGYLHGWWNKPIISQSSSYEKRLLCLAGIIDACYIGKNRFACVSNECLYLLDSPHETFNWRYPFARMFVYYVTFQCARQKEVCFLDLRRTVIINFYSHLLRSCIIVTVETRRFVCTIIRSR